LLENLIYRFHIFQIFKILIIKFLLILFK